MEAKNLVAWSINKSKLLAEKQAKRANYASSFVFSNDSDQGRPCLPKY